MCCVRPATPTGQKTAHKKRIVSLLTQQFRKLLNKTSPSLHSWNARRTFPALASSWKKTPHNLFIFLLFVAKLYAQYPGRRMGARHRHICPRRCTLRCVLKRKKNYHSKWYVVYSQKNNSHFLRNVVGRTSARNRVTFYKKTQFHAMWICESIENCQTMVFLKNRTYVFGVKVSPTSCWKQ